MNKTITYSNINSQIDERIKKKKVIPYSIYPGEKYIKGKWYYSSYYDMFFRVLDLKYQDGELLYAYIQSDNNRYSSIATELCTDDYMISSDRKNIYRSYIFNSNIPYTGAEIRYWFFMHDINSFNPKYAEFWKYVDQYSLERLDERKKYKCYASIDLNGNLTNCRVKEYTTDIVAGKEKAFREYHDKDLKFLKEDMKKHEKLIKKDKKKSHRK